MMKSLMKVEDTRYVSYGNSCVVLKWVCHCTKVHSGLLQNMNSNALAFVMRLSKTCGCISCDIL